jgi:hypothetical protein
MTHSPMMMLFQAEQSPVMSPDQSVSEQGTNNSEIFNFQACHSHRNMN